MIPADTAHDTVEALGEVGLLQFKDLNTDKSAFQRTYANQVCCCFRCGQAWPTGVGGPAPRWSSLHATPC
jgi:hypothetical protein